MSTTWQTLPEPSLRSTFYGWLRQLPSADELQRWAW